MLTRCPACHTSFRIRPEQLRARQGRVRCGHCSQPFNALASLLEEDGLTPIPAERLDDHLVLAPPRPPMPQHTEPPEAVVGEAALPGEKPAGEAGTRLFVLEETVEDLQQTLPIPDTGDEIPELYIDGWSAPSREAARPAAEPPPAATGSDPMDATLALEPAQGESGSGLEAPAEDPAPGAGSPFLLEELRPAEAEAAWPVDQEPPSDAPDLLIGLLSDQATPSPRHSDMALPERVAEADAAQDGRERDFSIEFDVPDVRENDSDAVDRWGVSPQAPPDPPFTGALADPWREPPQPDPIDTPPLTGEATAPETSPEEPAPPASLLPRIQADPADEGEAFSTLPLGGGSPSSAEDASGFVPTSPETERSGLWGLGIGTLAMLLALLAALYFRQSLIQIVPESQPLYASLCARLGCTMSLPREAGYIAIDSSDLRPEESQPGRFRLAAVIENRAPFRQALPHLELTLTDGQDRPMARRVLAPRDWQPGRDPEAGFEAASRIEAEIPFEVRDLQPVGYRVYAFYP